LKVPEARVLGQRFYEPFEKQPRQRWRDFKEFCGHAGESSNMKSGQRPGGPTSLGTGFQLSNLLETQFGEQSGAINNKAPKGEILENGNRIENYAGERRRKQFRPLQGKKLPHLGFSRTTLGGGEGGFLWVP